LTPRAILLFVEDLFLPDTPACERDRLATPQTLWWPVCVSETRVSGQCWTHTASAFRANVMADLFPTGQWGQYVIQTPLGGV